MLIIIVIPNKQTILSIVDGKHKEELQKLSSNIVKLKIED